MSSNGNNSDKNGLWLGLIVLIVCVGGFIWWYFSNEDDPDRQKLSSYINEIFNNDSANNIPIDSDVEFHIPEGNIMDKWTFTSSDGRFEMEFVPVLDRAACIDFKMLVSDQHQVFGRMSGKAVLDDGTVIEVKDMMCFAEKVHNRY